MKDLNNIRSFELGSLQQHEIEEILLVLVFKNKISSNQEYVKSLQYILDFYLLNYYSVIDKQLC